MSDRPTRVLFMTSNGVGMGHLTRLLAVATRLQHGAGHSAPLELEADPDTDPGAGTATPDTTTPDTTTLDTATPDPGTPGTATPDPGTPGTATPGTATPGTTTAAPITATPATPADDVGPVQPVFASLSTGVHVVERFGMPHTYIPSSQALAMPGREWELYLQRRITRLLSQVEPDVMVFDGVFPYDGLIENLKQTRAHGPMKSVWMRRAMWRPETSARALHRAKHFDLVIEPGDHAASYDAGVTGSRTDATRVAPITLLSPDQLLSREEARAELGYGLDERIALITLGAGNVRDLGPVQSQVLDWFARRAPGWRPVLTRAPISEAESGGAFDTLQVYPLAKYTRAFDMAMSSCGYNAFHEWTTGGLPVLWLPITETPTDDQAARAQWAADNGLSFTLGSVSGAEVSTALDGHLTQLTDDAVRARMRTRLDALPAENGAFEAAQLVRGLFSTVDAAGV